MKFSCSQLTLIKAINTVSKAVSSKTTAAALKGILISVKNDKLILTASDIDLSIETIVDVTDSEDGIALVNAKFFEDIIRKLPNSLVYCRCENSKFYIKCLEASFTLLTLDYDEFPTIGMVNKLKKNEIKRLSLISLIKQVSFAASPDEKKGVLTGCRLEFLNSKLEIAALDGFRLAVASVETDSTADQNNVVIIPARILNELSKILSDSSEETISIVFDNKRAEIISENTRVVSRLLEGEFISYRNIIPSTFKHSAIVSKDDILSSLERASLFANEGANKLIRLDFTENEVMISSRSEEGTVNEIVETESNGENIIIGFNAKYLTDMLKAIEDDEVKFNLTSPSTACVVTPVDGDGFSYLILPVRITV